MDRGWLEEEEEAAAATSRVRTNERRIKGGGGGGERATSEREAQSRSREGGEEGRERKRESERVGERESKQNGLRWTTELIKKLLDVSWDMWDQGARKDSTACMLAGLARWFEWMRQNGVYDNTKIAVAEILGRDASLEDRGQALVDAVLDRGAPDNVTALLVAYE